MSRVLPLFLALFIGFVSENSLHGDEPAKKPTEQKKKSDQPKELYPLKLGSTWRYDAARTDKETKKSTKYSISNRVLAVRLFPKKLVLGLVTDEKWYHVREFESHFWTRHSSLGLMDAQVKYNEEEFIDEPKPGQPFDKAPEIESSSIYIRHPAKPGQKWLVDPTEKDGARMTFIAKDVKVTVRAGKFQCNHYRMTFPEEDFQDDIFICPGIGFVRYVTEDEVERTEYTLRSYRFQKD